MERDAHLSADPHPRADDPVVRSVVLACDRERAWRLLASADGLGRWLGADVRLDPRVGGALGVRVDDGTRRIGHVTGFGPGRSLAFEWAPAGDRAARSTVELTVEDDEAGGTRITVVERPSGGCVASWVDAGAAWDARLLGLELDALVTSPLAPLPAPTL